MDNGLFQQHINMWDNVNYIRNVAKYDGLPSDSIMKLVNAIGSLNLSVSAIRAVLACIIPRNEIPDDAIFQLTFFLGDLEFEVTNKIEILNWMNTTLSVIESLKTKFNFLYEIYLNLLQNEVLRSNVICLLKHISTKENVTSNRIQFVVDLLDDEELQQCLNIFYGLQPHLVNEIFPDFEEIHSTFESWTTENNIQPPETDLYGRKVEPLIIPIQEADLYCRRDEPLIFQIQESDLNCESTDADSIMHTQESYSNCGNSDTDSIHMQVSSSFEEIYKNFLALKVSPMEKILKSSFRRLLITSDTNLDLQKCFYDYLLASSWNQQDFNSSLPLILKVLREKQEPITAVSDFISMVIDVWDGSLFSVLLDILPYQEICCFKKIVYRMNILQKAMQTAPLISKCHLLYCLSRLYQNWAYVAFGSDENASSMQHRYKLSSFECHSVQVKELFEYSRYLNFLYEDILAENDFNPCLLNQVFFHYKRMNIFNKKEDYLILHYPTDTILNSVLFGRNLCVMENFCELILEYYKCISMGSYANSTHIKNKFQSSLLDFCNILWNKELNTDSTCQAEKKMFIQLQKIYPNLKNLFMFFKHPAFLLEIAQFYKDRRAVPTFIENVSDFEDLFTHLSENSLQNFVQLNKTFLSCQDFRKFF